METGLVHIYTGNGKGKTTTAVGLCTRALGQGFRVCYTAFNKNPQKYGYTEIESLKKLGADVFIFTKGHPNFDYTLTHEETRKLTQQGVEKIKQLVVENEYQLLVIDEILISIRDKFIEEAAVVEFIKNKPQNLELVLTGRAATPTIIGLADYVSEINCISHPFEKGIPSRKGIEF